MNDSMENPFASNEAAEQEPQGERERMMLQSDQDMAHDIRTRMNRDNIFSGLHLELNK